MSVILFSNEVELICLHTLKEFQVLLWETNCVILTRLIGKFNINDSIYQVFYLIPTGSLAL